MRAPLVGARSPRFGVTDNHQIHSSKGIVDHFLFPYQLHWVRFRLAFELESKNITFCCQALVAWEDWEHRLRAGEIIAVRLAWSVLTLMTSVDIENFGVGMIA